MVKGKIEGQGGRVRYGKDLDVLLNVDDIGLIKIYYKVMVMVE